MIYCLTKWSLHPIAVIWFQQKTIARGTKLARPVYFSKKRMEDMFLLKFYLFKRKNSSGVRLDVSEDSGLREMGRDLNLEFQY